MACCTELVEVDLQGGPCRGPLDLPVTLYQIHAPSERIPKGELDKFKWTQRARQENSFHFFSKGRSILL